MKEKITQKRLKELIRYNHETGIPIWIVDKARAKEGLTSGCINPDGYRIIKIDGVVYLAHRLAWLYVHGYLPEGYLDHINRVRDDNRIVNLREVSPTCNAINRSIQSNNTSDVTGVHFDKKRNRWVPQIKVKRKPVFLGRFKEFADAVLARWNAEKKYNFPNCCTTSSAYEYLKSNNLL